MKKKQKYHYIRVGRLYVSECSEPNILFTKELLVFQLMVHPAENY